MNNIILVQVKYAAALESQGTDVSSFASWLLPFHSFLLWMTVGLMLCCINGLLRPYRRDICSAGPGKWNEPLRSQGWPPCKKKKHHLAA